jgi:hypothetical protein
MQKLKNISINGLVAVFVVLFSAATASAQDLDKAVVQKFINSKHFVFKAQTALPMTGGSRQLTGGYDVKILGDSLVSYLPYFGRAYSVTPGQRGGINFTSTKFDYKLSPRKKGGWNITIRPSDTRDVRELNFTISENGYATLQVNSNNRQPISFYGYIVEKK